MNSVVLKGNIAGDIYLNQKCGRPLLRLLLYSSYPRQVTGLRIVLLDGRAKEFYTALRKGSEIAVIGHITTRQYERSFFAEIEARNLILAKSFSWANIDIQAPIVEKGSDKAVFKGIVGPEINFEWRQRKTDECSSVNIQHAFLQFDLFKNTYSEGLPIVLHGFVAELIFPYLRQNSEIAVEGILRNGKLGQRVIVAENVALLRNIDYVRAAAVQARRMQMWEIDYEEFE